MSRRIQGAIKAGRFLATHGWGESPWFPDEAGPLGQVRRSTYLDQGSPAASAWRNATCGVGLATVAGGLTGYTIGFLNGVQRC